MPHTGKKRKRFWWENLHKKGYLEELNTDRRIIIKHILQSRMGKCKLDSPGSRYELLWLLIMHNYYNVPPFQFTPHYYFSIPFYVKYTYFSKLVLKFFSFGNFCMQQGLNLIEGFDFTVGNPHGYKSLNNTDWNEGISGTLH